VHEIPRCSSGQNYLPGRLWETFDTHLTRMLRIGSPLLFEDKVLSLK
jgi:hypothetical protein